MSESELNQLFEDIVMVVGSVSELGLSGPDCMTVLFPPDSMQFGLGRDVVIEVTALFDRPERTSAVLALLAQRLGEAVQRNVPGAQKIECFIYPFNPSNGCWSSTGWS